MNVSLFTAPEVSKTVFISFHSFFFILLLGSYLAHLFIFIPQLFCYDSFQCIFHFIYSVVQHCLFFSSLMSILNISCIFSICASILFPRFWDHLYSHCSEFFFQVNYLFPLNFSHLIGFYLAPSSVM